MRELIWNENRVIAEPVTINWFAEGKADAAFNYPPAHPSHDIYWEGYCAGLREKFLAQKVK